MDTVETIIRSGWTRYVIVKPELRSSAELLGWELVWLATINQSVAAYKNLE